jgi:DNA-binding MarR family transcriptional regulator
MPQLSKLAELRKLLRDMEREMGLRDLTPSEYDIICAAVDLEKNSQSLTTAALLEHKLVVGVSRPTFFRALKSLLGRGFLDHAEDAKRGSYVVTARQCLKSGTAGCTE